MRAPSTIPAIILAAGASSRLGQPKQLLVWKGEPLVVRAVRIAREAGLAPVVLVLGAHADLIMPALEGKEVEVLRIDGWEEGMSASLRAGIRFAQELKEEVEAVLLMVVDQPLLDKGHLQNMVKTWEEEKPDAVVSGYGNTWGVPVILGKAAFGEALELRGDKGARALIRKGPLQDLRHLPFPMGETDVDTPSDWAQLKHADRPEK